MVLFRFLGSKLKRLLINDVALKLKNRRADVCLTQVVIKVTFIQKVSIGLLQ